MDMTVNRLPARTWNWLKMNETVLSSVRAVPAAGDLGGKRFPGRK
ncbi:MAG: hypothetical protein ACLR2E_05485 [Lachnospiraceae bacterium]